MVHNKSETYHTRRNCLKHSKYHNWDKVFSRNHLLAVTESCHEHFGDNLTHCKNNKTDEWIGLFKIKDEPMWWFQRAAETVRAILRLSELSMDFRVPTTNPVSYHEVMIKPVLPWGNNYTVQSVLWRGNNKTVYCHQVIIKLVFSLCLLVTFAFLFSRGVADICCLHHTLNLTLHLPYCCHWCVRRAASYYNWNNYTFYHELINNFTSIHKLIKKLFNSNFLHI